MDTKKIGSFIAKCRKERGLTQEALGNKLGVSNKTVSRWENGNYMPDLSLLIPLSEELGITLNELLQGNKIESEKDKEYSYTNLINTIDYSNSIIKDEHRKFSYFIFAIGTIAILCAFLVISPYSSLGMAYASFGSLMVSISLFREIKFSRLKKVTISILSFVFLISTLIFADYILTSSLNQPPVFKCAINASNDEFMTKEYKGFFYSVYIVNANTPNQYIIIDTKNNYNLNTLPKSPFNRNKSGIDNIIKYHSKYIGNNSNTGALIESLPLSEHGFVFKIDSKGLGLIIDYHFSDWYGNYNLYNEKALVYNSVALLSLLDNLKYIKFNFSGSSYYVSKSELEKNFPNYDDIFIKGSKNLVDRDKFNIYVEEKINHEEFVDKVFSMFTKSE